MSSGFAKKSERTLCCPLASRSALLRIVRCRPTHLRCEPSASGSQLKRRSDKMNELRLCQKVGANDMLSARIALPRCSGQSAAGRRISDVSPAQAGHS